MINSRTNNNTYEIIFRQLLTQINDSVVSFKGNLIFSIFKMSKQKTQVTDNSEIAKWRLLIYSPQPPFTF